MERRVDYAIGQQDFKQLREGGALYVDKTAFVAKIAESKTQYYFLARPRRFGKSLFLSTLRYFFEGKRDLFRGLYIDSINRDWTAYPVLYIDLNTDKYDESKHLEENIVNCLREWEKLYDVEKVSDDISVRFRNVIKGAHEKTGQPVVILVDEYDKPLVGNLNKDENFQYFREKLSSFYSNFKSSAEHIRLVFLTGVSRFSKLSVFSDLNNLDDISFTEDFADICGITEKELHDNFQEGISKLSETEGWSYEKTCEKLKRIYDGYRFSKFGSDIYNPWSLLKAMKYSGLENYWIETGFPTILAESLKRVNADLKNIFDTYCTEDDLKGLDLHSPRPLALLYQTGYLTIKSYNKKIKRLRLGIPNDEVRKGFFDMLLPYYVKCKTTTAKHLIEDISARFILGEPDAAMKSLQSYFAGVDYKLKLENENNFQNAFFLLTDLIGMETKAEVHTSEGSIDLVIETDDYIYIIELKYDHSAESALCQINEKHYARPYLTDDRKLFKIGVSFSSKSRCIEDWIIV